MVGFIREYRFDTAPEFLNALAPWSSSPSLDGYIFRGHSDVRYLLAPTSIREESKKTIWDNSLAYAEITGSTSDNDYSLAYVEYQLIRDFYREADIKGLHVPISERLRSRLHQKIDFYTMSTWTDGDMWLPDDMLEVAALAQHYGVPTRLLDWTYDPFVAAFFASRPSGKIDGELCVWGLDARAIAVIQSIGQYFPLRLVTPHYSGNPNLAAQSGLFSHWAQKVPGLKTISSGEIKELPPVDRRPLDVLIKDYLGVVGDGAKELFVKMVLPNSQSLELARLLRKLGYGPAKMFPGYEGVAMELKERLLLKKVKEKS
ncbi:FRG domain-containing protein [Pseudomonas sp. A-RE-23]|uniref:FRG domain-containing protein n=1 Tax=Pseudomonas sp. A-RE-23 TaxID=2832376 RepID=UPI001CBF500D|nr:FRG domain-containing protein [Pseudomonas sp. A-RE-23]